MLLTGSASHHKIVSLKITSLEAKRLKLDAAHYCAEKMSVTKTTLNEPSSDTFPFTDTYVPVITANDLKAKYVIKMFHHCLLVLSQINLCPHPTLCRRTITVVPYH